jgi:hypothetical protein
VQSNPSTVTSLIYSPEADASRFHQLEVTRQRLQI